MSERHLKLIQGGKSEDGPSSTEVSASSWSKRDKILAYVALGSMVTFGGSLFYGSKQANPLVKKQEKYYHSFDNTQKQYIELIEESSSYRDSNWANKISALNAKDPDIAESINGYLKIKKEIDDRESLTLGIGFASSSILFGSCVLLFLDRSQRRDLEVLKKLDESRV